MQIANHPTLLLTRRELYDNPLSFLFNSSLITNPYALYNYNLRVREEPKPSYSYIGLIAMAILSSADRQLVLADIYRWILDHYPYFRSRGTGWRNSIRHNLSLNECFVKANRSANGKGHYWTIHPANLADFLSGDFRRQRANRRARKSMGLPALENEQDYDGDNDEILPISQIEHPSPEDLHPVISTTTNNDMIIPDLLHRYFHNIQQIAISQFEAPLQRKRCFNVDSLLAPEQPCSIKRQKYRHEVIYSPYSKSDGSTDISI